MNKKSNIVGATSAVATAGIAGTTASGMATGAVLTAGCTCSRSSALWSF